MRLSTRLVSAVMLIVLPGLAFLAWVVQRDSRLTLIAQSTHSLEALRASRARSVEIYLERMRAAVYVSARAILVRQMTEQMAHALHGGARAAQAPEYSALRKTFNAHVQTWLNVHGWYDLSLVAPDGEIVYSLRAEAGIGTNALGGALTTTGLGATTRRALAPAHPADVFASDVAAYAPSGGSPAAFFAAPIFNGDSTRQMGAFVVQIAITGLDAITNDRTGLSPTTEVYIVGADSVMRTSSAVLGSQQVPQVRTDAVRRALSGEAGAGQIHDYRGKLVLSAFAPLQVDGNHWAIIEETDIDDILAPLRRSQINMAIVAGL
jgi:methyl-accepting chemotaxis protein